MFSAQNEPRFMIRIIEKIIENNNLNAQMVKVLEELSQIDTQYIEDSVFEKLDCKYDGLFLRVMDWVISRKAKE